ncbi:hypothetical protein CEUSTIGMA_g11549.t1 [Chlamydomonas eustigma]|uniref:RNA helicase n=1 Tax=Chlamydomonas eustigma TaxID=1157962 RepID=A0A250XM78_9CHLO|nr:hypothetical protein CEUSTIGMA_g11549.t1 [Chlamydomonas eustigma]|eukprot:GAX84126.1 hypothetical protein CEUSTIGMA_g11549.t1 [Chlamydomonas eustigma]
MSIFPVQSHLDRHMLSRKHTSMLGRKMLEDVTTHGMLQSNKAGLVVSVPEALTNLAPKQRAEVALVIVNTSNEMRVLCALSQLQPATQVILTDPQGVTHGTQKRLPPGSSYVVSAHIQSDHIGVFRTVVVLDFGEHGMIGRALTARYDRDEYAAGSTALPDIGPTAPFTPRTERMKVIRDADVEEGQPPPKSAFQYSRRPSSDHRPPFKLVQMFDAGRAAGSLLSLLPREPVQSIADYVQKMATLLHIEELQHEVEVRIYDMQDVELTGNSSGQFLQLKVEGLAEGRPSVLKGDAIFVRPASSVEGSKEYKGYVHAVKNIEVDLKFSPGFHRSWIKGMKFQVRFGINRSAFYFMQDALHRLTLRSGPHPSLILPSLSSSATSSSHASSAKASSITAGLLSSVSRIATEVLCTGNNILNPPAPPSPYPLNQGCSFPNAAQQAAINAVLSPDTRSPLPLVIFGPPGTGKTSTVVETIIQVLRTQPRARVLACAPSNSASDLLALRVLQSRPPSEMLRLVAFNRPKEDVPTTLFNKSGVTNWDKETDAFTMPSEAALRNPQKRIIVCTCLMAAKLWCAGSPEGFFSHIFVDEAGHAEEPLLMCALAGHASSSGSTRVVLAGDPMQLGPIILSRFAREKGLGSSTLERLVLTEPAYSVCQTQPVAPQAAKSTLGTHVTLLEQNYRSHSDIIRIPNYMFYFNRLKECGDRFITHKFLSPTGCSWEHLPNKSFPFIFHALEGEDFREGKSPSWFNVMEAKQVLKYVTLLKDMKRNRVNDEDIGVISPYRRQVQKIQALLSTKSPLIKVGSVEEFQGQERQVVIISTVRSSEDHIEMDLKHRLGFLSNPKRFNVSITRAKSLVIIIGNPKILCQDPCWRILLKYIHANKGCTGSPMPLDLLNMEEQGMPAGEDMNGGAGSGGGGAYYGRGRRDEEEVAPAELNDLISRVRRMLIDNPSSSGFKEGSVEVIGGHSAVRAAGGSGPAGVAGSGSLTLDIPWFTSEIEGGEMRRVD